MSGSSSWHFRDLWTESPAGTMSLAKVCSIVGVIGVTATLIVAVRERDLPLGLLIEYAISVTILTSPVLGGRLIGLWHSRYLAQTTTSEPTPPAPTPPPGGGKP